MPLIPAHRPPQSQVSLADYTTWKVGGPAEWFAEPVSREELIALALWAFSEGLPLRLIGAGSNLLVSDGGLDGLTLCNRRLQGSVIESTTGLVEAQAGEPIPTLARKAARAGLSGLEWAVGIPGTVGGAAVMNAGAQGGCTADWLQEVTVLDPTGGGEPFVLQSRELEFAYRHSRLQREPLLVLSARFGLSAGHDPAEISRRTSANLSSRTSSQPYQQPSCGSVFRNPEPRKAGQLIEQLGLKGLAVGGAMVSPIHANFIVNTGSASAHDIDRLIQLVQQRVFDAHGIELHPEVKRLGSFPAGRTGSRSQSFEGEAVA
ncbi:UDP-N-acetylmuramate dehydrogenase [Synechococcus sp. BSF8S]|uniref:UDP-N-acetylmuramate dehydrogenase n=1 Tax=Synechococcales TaxID=1890424 RepID=UPI0016253A16|nr:UDP-N-acetylmuramate dehydrogenase [Synechococcus sp. BSF8S]MBC1263737.1 UDP-N-acetylmuramate dehydrogenase [Synechococcus sp. BSA11S]